MEVPLKINTIFDGQAPSQYFGMEGTFIASTAIDPDFPISANDIKTSGFPVPIGYSVFSGANVNAAPIAIINTPKDANTYVVLTNGRLISYSSSFGSETLIGTVAGGTAGGAAYYNNYIYIFGTGASANDVSRYGPLSGGVAALTDGVWTGATLGSQAVLSNTTYPTLRSVLIPNHWGFVHGDNSLYFLDFESKTSGSTPGQGLVHRIHTKKTTVEGDTNDTTVPSSYSALDLPFGFYPTALTNVSTNVLITGIYSTNNTISQGQAAFCLWNPTDTVSFFLGPIPLPDTLATATLTANGRTFIWTGNAQNGVRVSRYIGGESVSDVAFQEEGLPPLAGAVASNGNRISWGGFTTNPNDRGCVWSFGSKDGRLPPGLHNTVKVSSSGVSPFATAIKYVQQDSYKQPKVIVAWRDNTSSGIDKYDAAATLGSNMRWMFNIGKRFQIIRIRIPLAGAVGANTSIQPKVYIDDLSSTPATTLLTINNTNFPGERKVYYKGPQLANYFGENNFVFELSWSGTDPLAPGLPILIDVDVKEDEQK